MTDYEFEFDLELDPQQQEELQQEQVSYCQQTHQPCDLIDSPLLSNADVPELSSSLQSLPCSLLQTPLLYDSKINSRSNSLYIADHYIESFDLNNNYEQPKQFNMTTFENAFSDLKSQNANDVINMGSKQIQLNYQKWMNSLKY
ncbi:hypothetical protein WICPIJ_004168 [Wickerhamomyces pijperi]|uniref:Uncharacterized protein n=1 Tax=Wickerhamomyces pijperi TaxID=599730 RepID=A0A9P8Q8G2_WICPI|nr:hypothetical protein WICPIJ_004168 [Wickerhamomyces pijperi]